MAEPAHAIREHLLPVKIPRPSRDMVIPAKPMMPTVVRDSSAMACWRSPSPCSFSTLPSGHPGSPTMELFRAWPAFLAYLVSFLTIGAVWMAHHGLTNGWSGSTPSSSD
jgi:hypothetical protein